MTHLEDILKICADLADVISAGLTSDPAKIVGDVETVVTTLLSLIADWKESEAPKADK